MSSQSALISGAMVLALASSGSAWTGVDTSEAARATPMTSTAPPEKRTPVTRSAPYVRLGAVKVSGPFALPPDVLRRILLRYSGSIRRWYKAGLAKNAKLTGQMTARFVIDEDGSSSRATDAGSDLPDAAVIQCILDLYLGSFPRSEGDVTVTYTLSFYPP
jgi:hypothetical protein